MYGLRESDLGDLVRIIASSKDVETAILFGSRAMGNFKPGSDVDIALKGPAVNRETVICVSSCLNEETLMPYHFDVLNFNTIDNQDLCEHIGRVGKIIYTKEQTR